ncbi:SapC family protein [Methylocystis echinoides]|uniref:Peptidase n=1 Tax=Methylocystis echinoides TaxID=29468 RepID=A0A9W6GWS6_9HYPH|nr:SapC family protein [Methylocystis echinoides]GLI94260.1 peptidase [Methylocystis echinoides]
MTGNNIPSSESNGATLPLFYKDPVVLRFEQHADVGLVPARGFDFAREAVAILLCAGEFAVAMRHYPIVFAMDEQASPIALTAIRKEHNLFVEQDGSWRPGAYVPAYLRRYPFIVTETSDKSQRLLAVDRGSERYVAAVADRPDAERLFDDAGNATAAAQAAMAVCSAFHADYANTVAFGRALLAAKVLEPYHAEFRLPDGTLYQLNGFYAVDEKAFRALPAMTVADWHSKGWLDLLTLHLASQQSFQNLLDLNAQRANERKALA